jgi:hypothetical protein
MDPVYRRLLAMTLDESHVIEATFANWMRNWRGCSGRIQSFGGVARIVA